MRRLKLITAIVALLVTSVTFANENAELEKKKLHQQIVALLGNSTEKISDSEITAEVSFTLNSESEIVILSVASDNTSLKNLVKRKLNYKKVKVKALNEGKIYRMPLTIVNS